MNHLKFLPYTTVQISKESIYLGSAVLVKIQNTFYVLTAAHVSFGEGCEQYSEGLSSTLTYKSESIGELAFVREIGSLEIYKAHDILAIEVEVNSEDFPEILFSSDTDKPQLQFIFKGRAKSESGKSYAVLPCKKNSTTGADIHIEIPVKNYTDFLGDTGAQLLQGFSGSGVFIHDDSSNEAFLTSIVKSVSKDNFVGINCTCISLFKEHLIPEINLVDYDYQSSEKNTRGQSKLINSASQIDVEELTRTISQNLISQFMQTSSLGNSDIAVTHTTSLSSIEGVPLPAAIASRQKLIESTIYSLKSNGTAWLYGAAGVGKTVAAKMVAKQVGGSWIGVNLRGLSSQEVCQILSSSLININTQEVAGILIDDLECIFTPIVTEKLLNLHSFCQNINIFILFTSSKAADEDYLYSANLTQEVEQKVDDFSEGDIKEILSALGVMKDYWPKYIYMSSGGGHPQLVIAMIQSMKKNKWSIEEFHSLNSLLQKNETVEKVKRKTRERLLHELPISARKLIERVSLITGRFERNLVLDLALIPPEIPDGGINFDQLIGAWIDQHETDRFSLSPLLSNYAVATLTKSQQKQIQSEIANSILSTKVLDPITMNSAFIAALVGENTGALARLCYPLLTTELSDLQVIAPHLIMFTLLGTDRSIYKGDFNVNIMLRGAQVILLTCFEDKKDDYLKMFERFEIEREKADKLEAGSSVLIGLMVYSKLLLSQPKFGTLPNWTSIITKLDFLLKNKDKLLPNSIPSEEIPTEIDGVSTVSFLIMNQINQIKSIDALIPLFEFIDICEVSIREQLFLSMKHLDIGVDILIRGAWLSEYNEGTIDCEKHSNILTILESFANSWGYTELAVCCVQFTAIIWDESGEDKDQAIKVIDIGFAKYGDLNFCLTRAKAKVLFRSKDYGESLILSNQLIDSNAPINNVDKTFFYRDAAICAENEKRYSLARKYYLLGSSANSEIGLPENKPMEVGFKADAALASWHRGNKEECIQDLASVLVELKKIDPKGSLQAAHCHALCRHIILWLEQEATGQRKFISSGEEVVIFPGIVSNPVPHEDIEKQTTTPLELTWYMLASLENHCVLNLGISSKLTANLTKGPMVEGESLLASSKLDRAIMQPSGELFIVALKENVQHWVYLRSQLETLGKAKGINFTYITLPQASREDFNSNMSVVEREVLNFITSCVLQDKWKEISRLVDVIVIDPDVYFRVDLINILKGNDEDISDAITQNVKFLLSKRYTPNINSLEGIINVFSISLRAVQLGSDLGKEHIICRLVFESLKRKWLVIWERERYLLMNPDLNFTNINKSFSVKDYSWPENVVCLMKAILPTLGVGDEREVNRTLDELLVKFRT